MLPRQQLSGWRPCFPPTTERNNKTLEVWAWRQIRDPSRVAENTRMQHELKSCSRPGLVASVSHHGDTATLKEIDFRGPANPGFELNIPR